MLTKQELHRVDEYLFDHYTLTATDADYLNGVDDFILSCSLDHSFAVQNADRLLEQANDVHRKMSAVFLLDGGASPRLLEFQERYYQLLVLHRKATGQDNTAPLAMLCFSSSFDLFWLQARGSDTVS